MDLNTEQILSENIDTDIDINIDIDTNTNINIDTKFNSEWNLWYHHNKNDWTINGYKLLFKILTINDFWNFYNNLDLIGGINNQHFFLMREDIKPIWEDENNINGGCWSFKKNISTINDLWLDLSIYLLGETLYKNTFNINGISICMKKGKNSIIKIWVKDDEDNNIKLFNEIFINKWGNDVIYSKNIK